jgi:hypothetical protein
MLRTNQRFRWHKLSISAFAPSTAMDVEAFFCPRSGAFQKEVA